MSSSRSMSRSENTSRSRRRGRLVTKSKCIIVITGLLPMLIKFALVVYLDLHLVKLLLQFSVLLFVFFLLSGEVAGQVRDPVFV